MDSAAGLCLLVFQVMKKETEGSRKLFEGCPVDTITAAGSIHGTLHQSGRLQFLQVLGNGRLRQRQHFHNLSADTAVLLRQHFENGNAGWMRQGFGKSCQFLLLF